MSKKIIVFLVCVLLLVSWQPGEAQSDIKVLVDKAEVNFPSRLTFHLEASSTDPIDQAFLQYATEGRSCLDGVARQQIDFASAQQVMLEWQWKLKDSGNLPPGVTVWWQWEIHNVSESTLLTDRQTIIIEDGNYNWMTVQDDAVIVQWTQGDEQFGNDLLKIAATSLEKLSTEAGIQPLERVRLVVYPSFDSLRDATLFLPEWTGGVAYPQYGITMIGVPADSGDWSSQVIPHELAHLVTGEVTFNCLGIGLPTWLDEGLAMYAEGPTPSIELETLNTALEKATLPPLRNLTRGFSANSDQAALSYTQSGEVIRFLIQSYGPEKMDSLLTTIQSGKKIDPALQEVYGLDTDGIDIAWRDSLGFSSLKPVQVSTNTPKATVVPTLALWTPAFGMPSATLSNTPIPAVGQLITPTYTPTVIEDRTATAPVSTVEEQTSDSQDSSKTRSSPLPCLAGSTILLGLLIISQVPRFLKGKSK